MLLPLVGILFAVIGATMLFSSVQMMRVAGESVRALEPAVVIESSVVQEGSGSKMSPLHFQLNAKLRLGDGTEVGYSKGFGGRNEAATFAASFAPGI